MAVMAKSSMTVRERPLGGAFGIKENAVLLRRYAYVEEKLMKTQAAWVIHCPLWDVKLQLAQFLYEDSEHANWLRGRLKELRGANPNMAVDSELVEVMDEILHAEDIAAYLYGAFGVVKRELLNQYRNHLRLTDPLLDAPTVRWLQFIVSEEERQIAWFDQLDDLLHIPDDIRSKAENWGVYIASLLGAAGGIAGNEPSVGEMVKRPNDYRFVLTLKAQREDIYERCVRRNEPEDPTDDQMKLIWQFRHHRDEMQATEIFASILFEIEDMPWEFIHDVARHTWDEARHCQMGHQRLQEMGIKSTDLPVMTGNIEFMLTHLDPIARYAFTTLDNERYEMPNKKIKYERANRLNDPASAQCTDYDWSDEINHVLYGKKWVPQLLWMSKDVRSVEELLKFTKDLADKHLFSKPPGWPHQLARRNEPR